MSGLARAVAGAMILGLACCGPVGKASAVDRDGEGEESGEVPLYYRQLQDFTAAREREALRPKILQYTVQPGDCLCAIAARFDTDAETLSRLNSLANPSLIHPGDCLEILTVVGCVHDVEDGDTVSAIAETYGVEATAILQANAIRDPAALYRGERIIVPGGVISRAPAWPAFRWPLRGTLTSGYGWRNGKFHYGIDISAVYGTAFCAAAGGRVTAAGYRGSYGIMIEVDHGSGYRTRYGHACRAAVSAGQGVEPGQTLGFVGLTGNTTGPHLHFELYCGGEKVDPLQYLE